MQLDAVIAFFVLGALTVWLKAPIKFPKSLYDSITLFLMLAIGLKGGLALQEHASYNLIFQSFFVILFGLLLPFIAYPLLRYFGMLDRINAGAIAAHYGSVSVGTYAVAVALLESANIAYEAYFPLFVVLLEAPAIVVGIWLAKRQKKGTSGVKLDREIVINQSILLLMGGLLIGYIGGGTVDKIMPFFGVLFPGILALFLLEMGIVAAKRLRELTHAAYFIAAFGMLMPIIGGSTGLLLADMLQLSSGGMALMATLGASASYIAVPAAMRMSLPEADSGLSISTSLGVTFPFNVLVAVPFFIAVSQWLTV
ncbi:MAG: sodium-dependent bicarbonate transport family permease [Aestuariibacter sp.]